LKYVDSDDPDAPYSQDVWELYHVAIDPAETNDLAVAEPARLEAMKQLWWDEAWKYGALPLQARRSVATKRPQGPIGDTLHLRQGAAPLPEANAPFMHRRTTRLIADVTCNGDEGVLIAAGGRFAGFSLYLQDGHACFTYNYLGVDEHTVRAPMPSGRHIVTAEVRLIEADPEAALAARANPRVAGPSDISIIIDGKTLSTVHMQRSLPVRFSLAGEGICCGYDDCTPVSANYSDEFRYSNVIHRAMIDVSGREQRDLDAEFEAAWASQ
jgi:arylsulfatase